MKTLALIGAILLLSSICLATSDISSLERYSSAGGLSVLEVTLNSNATGYLSYTTPTLFGKLLAVDWYSASSLANNNTIVVTATAPYSRTITSYNMTNSSTTDYLTNVTIRSPLVFSKANGTSSMAATVFLYMER